MAEVEMNGAKLTPEEAEQTVNLMREMEAVCKGFPVAVVAAALIGVTARLCFGTGLKTGANPHDLASNFNEDILNALDKLLQQVPVPERTKQ